MGVRHDGLGRSGRRRLGSVIAVGVVLAGAASLPAAGASKAVAPASGGVTYTKQTVLVPSATVKKQLMKVSADGSTFTFKSKHGVLHKLKVGSTMLLQGVAVRDVTKVAKSHGHLVVDTDPAAITDLVQNGTIAWNQKIDFSKAFAVKGAAEPEARGLNRSVAARFGMTPLAGGKTIKITGKTHSYKYTATYTQENKAVGVSIAISKSKPVDVEAKIEGVIDNLKTAGNISVDHGSLAGTKMLANNLTGHFTLSYSAKPISGFGLGKAGGIKVEIPAGIAVPFLVGPVPFFLGINTSIFASAGFSGFDQALSGSYTFNYDGNGGFSTSSSGAASASGVLKGVSDILLNAKNAVANGPITFVFGAQMPQIELGLGAKGLNVAGNITLVGSTGIATYGSGCDTRQIEILADAGAEANFFGFSAPLAQATLFDKKQQAAYPAGCGTFPDNRAAAVLGG
jgi:hypothetical protein